MLYEYKIFSASTSVETDMKPPVECAEISVVPTVLDDSIVSSERHRR